MTPSPDELRAAVARLDESYPNGWRSGDRSCDAVVVLMQVSIARLGSALFGGTR